MMRNRNQRGSKSYQLMNQLDHSFQEGLFKQINLLDSSQANLSMKIWMS